MSFGHDKDKLISFFIVIRNFLYYIRISLESVEPQYIKISGFSPVQFL
jgi:hypothetical protein